jgi:two-component system LytT family sensor kinase
MNDLPIASNARTAAAPAASHDLHSAHAGNRNRWAGWVQGIVIVAIWATAYLVFTAQQLMNAPPERRWLFLVPRAISCGTGALISVGILAAQYRLRPHSLPTRAVAATALAVAGAAVLAAVNFPIFLPFMEGSQVSPVWFAFSWDFLTRLWIFASISGIILAFSYLADIRDREDRIAALQALAHSAQLRALRYQLNPHFLFNALNSIAGLISSKRPSAAETMTENLADFLRITLGLDPQKLITLGEEMGLQRLYLGVESVRFPDRLETQFDIPDELLTITVPALITQPLTENAIKYAVARSTAPVRLRISGRRSGATAHLLIENDGGNATAIAAKGASMGLANVAQRLEAHYGDHARFEAGASGECGFRNLIVIPIE